MAYDKEKWINEINKKKEEMEEKILSMARSYREKPEQIAELLEFSSRFYKYSLKNKMLIYSQDAQASYVQSYYAWKKMGYPPVKGAKGISIRVPVRSTTLQVKENGIDKLIPLKDASPELKRQYKNNEIKSYSHLNFKIGYVYDISDTDFPPEEYPSLFSVGYDSKDHAKVYEGLVRFNREVLKCDVVEEKIKYLTLRGSYSLSANRITINDKLKDTEKLSTLCHETGHAIAYSQGIDDKPQCLVEFEADSIGIMIVSKVGLPVEELRKRHLAEAYRRVEREVENMSESMQSDLELSVEGILSNVMEIYNRHVDQMDQRIQQSLGKNLGIAKEIKEHQEMESRNRERRMVIKKEIEI